MPLEVPVTVPVPLRRLVSEITSVRACAPAGGTPLVHLPDADTSLIFRTTSAPRSTLLVAGPRTRASYHVGKDFPLCLRLRLRPGAARLLFGVPMTELVDRVVDLEELWDGAAGLTAPPGDDVRDVLRRLQAALPARVAARSNADVARSELVRATAQALRDQAGQRREPVAAIARRLAVSERHMRDLVRDGVGVPPKRMERIERVRRVLAQGRGLAGGRGPAGGRVLAGGRAHTARWAQLAAIEGFYDQSHMTAEFRTLMGVPPAAFFAGRLPSLEPC
ncbi:helix-turn-helix domain-containing protein [Microbispora hainanensis]|uniref:Helix-turn-helix transcriptional regulator n=1 Tax=Microbispora hainanensis TaxID=568844 RepID=A0A544YL40_9ACTN|nr:AraC family transcriptional regulator [Microbispora hainanensis]TQS17495.1 helix-turn-helix transcriptional regulator [Microbispora hainanensis]